MKTSLDGRDLIAHFEGGHRLTVYLDPAGLPTVGCGHLVRPADDLKVGDRISQSRSDRFLEEDLEEAERIVDSKIPPGGLAQHRFDALVSFAFNAGGRPFLPSRAIGKALASGRLGMVPGAMRLYRKAGFEILPGLVRRREAEGRLFQGLDWRDPPPAAAPRTLRRSMDGDDVEKLQSQLIQLDYGDLGVPTGIFADRTEAAVCSFQKAQGLKVDGLAGPLTIAALKKALAEKGGSDG